MYVYMSGYAADKEKWVPSLLALRNGELQLCIR